MVKFFIAASILIGCFTEAKAQTNQLQFYIDIALQNSPLHDFGKGLPEAFDLTSRSSTSLGMQLIRTLVRSLDGVIDAGSDGGAWFAITFQAKPAHG